MARWGVWLGVNVLLICILGAIAQTEYVLYKDPTQPPAARVKDLLSRMTLAEKIGQMTQIDRSKATADVMKTYCIGNDVLLM